MSRGIISRYAHSCRLLLSFMWSYCKVLIEFCNFIYIFTFSMNTCNFSPESEICLWIKPKKKKKLFCGKFGSMPTFRSTRKGKKCSFVMSLSLSDHKVPHNIDSIFIKFLSISLGFSRCFSLYFGWNVIKQLFHSRLLDMRLVIANSALHASLAIYHLISVNLLIIIFIHWRSSKRRSVWWIFFFILVFFFSV